MRKLITTICVCGFTGLGSAHASNAASLKTLAQQAAQFENRLCGVNPNRTLFRNPKYEETVLFYQNHIPKGQLPLAEVLTKFKTKSARAAHIKEFVGANYSIVRKMDEVVFTIGDRLIAKKLTWLGLEKAPDEMDAAQEEELYKTAVALETQFKKDKVKPKDLNTYLTLQMGPILYARWKNQQLRKVTKLVALDDITIRMKSGAYSDSTEQKATVLLESVAHSGIRTSDMEQIIDLSQVALFSGVKDRTPEYLAIVAKIKKPAVKKQVEDYRTWIEQGIDSLAERDEAAAKMILAQTGMGLILLSANFGPGVSDRLMEVCPGAKKKTSP